MVSVNSKVKIIFSYLVSIGSNQTVLNLSTLNHNNQQGYVPTQNKNLPPYRQYLPGTSPLMIQWMIDYCQKFAYMLVLQFIQSLAGKFVPL